MPRPRSRLAATLAAVAVAGLSAAPALALRRAIVGKQPTATVTPTTPATPPAPGTVEVVQTDPALGQALTPQPALPLSTVVPATGSTIVNVDDFQRFQRVSGFGAAMTDSSAWLLETQLEPSTTASVMQSLFSPSGLHLSVVRIPIGASDYTAGGTPYTYDDLPAHKTDPKLKHFSIAHDDAYILPALRQVRALNPKVELLATPWTSPAWMKGNHSLSNVDNRGTLIGADYGPWAAYIVKFLQAYAAAGVPVNALTPTNEPGNPTPYPGMSMTAKSESNWITQWLVPALTRAHLDPMIYGGDLGWNASTYAQQLLRRKARNDLTGVAWHCYYGNPSEMVQVHDQAPGLGMIVSECSPGISTIPIPEVLISALRDWATSVSLWNVALDPHGGPVQLPNKGCPGCYGLYEIAEQTHVAAPLPPYYDLGQASEFIQPGAYVVAANNFVAYDYQRPGVNFITSGLDDVALENPDGSHVLLAYNNSAAPISFAVEWEGFSFQYAIPPGAMTTFDWG